MPRKITRKGLKKKCDTLFSLQVRSLGYCELRARDNIHCGGVLQCAHIIGRSAHSIRWNKKNALCICEGHHVWYTNNPNAWREIVLELFPEKWEYVQAHRNEIWNGDLDKVYSGLNGSN